MPGGVPFEWQVGWRHVRGAVHGNRFIAFISRVSMLGIALGVAALVVVLSVVNGFQVEVRDRMLALVPHLTLLQRDGGADGADTAAGFAAAARADPRVRATAPAVLGDALLGRGERLRGAALRGIDPAQETAVSPLVAALDPALRAALQPGSNRLLLGAELARELGAKAGDAVVVVQPGAGGSPRMTPFTVAGVFSAGHYEFDQTLALLHLDDARALFGLARPNALQLQLRDALQAPALARELRAALPRGSALRDWTQVNRTWFESVQLQRRMLAVILTLIVAVAAFNLVATLVMTVTDKRGEIAILRTLGASPASVMAIFVVQGVVAGVVGTGGGIALGLAIAHNLPWALPALERAIGRRLLAPNVYLLDHLPSLPLAADIVPVAAVSLALSLLATLYPSWRASRLRPAEALRGE